MAIYQGDKKIIPFKGDYEPLAIYEGDKVIFEPVETEKQGTILNFENTYNDTVREMSVHGKSVQDEHRLGILSGEIVQFEDGKKGGDCLVEIKNPEYPKFDEQGQPLPVPTVDVVQTNLTHEITLNTPTKIALFDGFNKFTCDYVMDIQYEKAESATPLATDSTVPTAYFQLAINSAEGEIASAGRTDVEKSVCAMPVLRSVGDVHDEWHQDGSWTQRINERTTQPTDLWNVDGEYYYALSWGEKILSAETTNACCDKAKVVKKSDVPNQDVFCLFGSGAGYPEFNGKILGLDTLEEWKIWVANNPITILYQLAEPIHHPAPVNFEPLKTYPHATTISTNSEIQPQMEGKVKTWQ